MIGRICKLQGTLVQGGQNTVNAGLPLATSVFPRLRMGSTLMVRVSALQQRLGFSKPQVLEGTKLARVHPRPTLSSSNLLRGTHETHTQTQVQQQG